MTSPLKEQIERIGREIANTESELADLIRRAESDGDGITPEDEEYPEIQQTRKELKEARRLHKAKEDEFNANRAEWNGKSGAISELKSRLSRMADFGIEGVTDLQTAVTEAESAAADERFRDACDRFDAAEASAENPWAEYERQTEAQESYNSERSQVETAAERFRTADVTSDALTSATGQIDTNLTSANAAAEGNDFVEALSLLRLGNPEVARGEAELTRLVGEKTAAEEQLAALRDRVATAETEAAEFEELATRLAALPPQIAEAETMIANSDFSTAQGHIATLDYEVEAIQSAVPIMRAEREAEEARIAAERELWEQAQPRWSELQQRVDELTEWNDSASVQLGNMVSTVGGHAEAEEFQLACDALAQAEQATIEPWQQHQAQVEAKTTYDQVRPGLDDRLGQAGTSEYVDEAAAQQLSQIETSLTRMSDLSGGKDYVAANDETQGVASALDTVEQALRENQARAEAAEAMGVDPNTSNAELEAEVNRQLYEEERGLLQNRATAARGADVTGPDIERLMGQLETDMTSIQATADGGDYGQALQDVRARTATMAGIEEMIRDQAERKARYGTARESLLNEANRLIQAEFVTVSDTAAHVQNAMSEIENVAAEGRYEEALADVQRLQADLDQADRDGLEMAARKADVDARMSALRPRLDAAAQNDYPEVQPTADGVTAKEQEVSDRIAAEDFQGALDLVPGLVELLEMYEEEAERQHGYERYQDALATLELETRLMDMRASIYPETDELKEAVEAADTARLRHEEAGEWAEARTAAYDESDKIGQFKSEELRITGAKASYEAEAPALIAGAQQLSADGQTDETGAIAQWETTLSGIRARMETAAEDERWLEALEVAEEFRQSLSQAEDDLRDLFQATDSVINSFISTKVMPAQNAVTGSLIAAINGFRTYVLGVITAERDYQTAVRRVNYALDLGAAWASIVPGVDDVVGAVLSTVKITAEAVATERDDADDAADQALADELIQPVLDKAMNLGFNPDIGPWLKRNNSEVYKTIGNRLHETRNDPEGAERALMAIGIPTRANYGQFYEYYSNSLRSDFDRARR